MTILLFEFSNIDWILILKMVQKKRENTTNEEDKKKE
jgi:hypothetical protein